MKRFFGALLSIFMTINMCACELDNLIQMGTDAQTEMADTGMVDVFDQTTNSDFEEMTEAEAITTDFQVHVDDQVYPLDFDCIGVEAVAVDAGVSMEIRESWFIYRVENGEEILVATTIAREVYILVHPDADEKASFPTSIIRQNLVMYDSFSEGYYRVYNELNRNEYGKFEIRDAETTD